MEACCERLLISELTSQDTDEIVPINPCSAIHELYHVRSRSPKVLDMLIDVYTLSRQKIQEPLTQDNSTL